MSNRLVNEKSPYLLQHADNPVDWHPWSPQAFEAARKADKPIFLSIGYAACHWCHVMEKESFEDAQAARLLNDTFVCIKVDREERADIDAVYMSACQLISGRGGWPLTIFMTPDKDPFFAATYLPKENRFGRTGLLDLCRQVDKLWRTDRLKVVGSAAGVRSRLLKAFDFAPGGDPGAEVLETAAGQLRSEYDPQHGGFQPAPKFPLPHRLQLLLRRHRRTGAVKDLQMATRTLEAMRQGGIWDHLGFGFHRYSTDDRWLVPHFEKMLYDQALLATAYLEAFQVTSKPCFNRTAREIFTYVLRDMTSDTGPFFAAEDADSEGREGKFYLWTEQGLSGALGTEDGARWSKILGFEPGGNFSQEASGRRSGENIVHLKVPLEQWAAELGISTGKLERQWETVRQKLFNARETRVHPLKDDKILTDWNGLMIAALAMGSRVLGETAYLAAAIKAADWILTRLTDSGGRLLHRFRDGEAAIRAHAEDYAFLIAGLLELYRACFDLRWLNKAALLQEEMLTDFWDAKRGGFFLTPADQHDLPVRPIEIYDGAIPSANSVSYLNLLELFGLTGRAKWQDRARELGRIVSGTLQRHPAAFFRFLWGVDFQQGPHRQVVILGRPDDGVTREMISVVNGPFDPLTSVLLKDPDKALELARIAEFTGALEPPDSGAAAAFVCSAFTCHRRVDSPGRLAQILAEKA